MSSDTPRATSVATAPTRAAGRSLARAVEVAGAGADAGRVGVVVVIGSMVAVDSMTFACRHGGRSRVGPTARPAPVARLDRRVGRPNAADSESARRTSSIAPAAATARRPGAATWPNPSGISSRWWDTRTMAVGRALGGERARGRAAGVSRAARSRLAVGSSRNRTSGPASAPGRSTSAVARRPTASRTAGRGGRPGRARRRGLGALPVGLVVDVPPRLERPVAGGHDQVAGTNSLRDEEWYSRGIFRTNLHEVADLLYNYTLWSYSAVRKGAHCGIPRNLSRACSITNDGQPFGMLTLWVHACCGTPRDSPRWPRVRSPWGFAPTRRSPRPWTPGCSRSFAVRRSRPHCYGVGG